VSLAGVVVLLAGLLPPLSLEAVESAFLPLHPESASDRYRPSVSATKRVRMIPSMSGWFIRKTMSRTNILIGR
jgi:hypothetical protein